MISCNGHALTAFSELQNTRIHWMFYQRTTKQMKTCNKKTFFFHVPIFILNMIQHPLQATCSQKYTGSSVDTSNTEVKNDTEKKSHYKQTGRLSKNKPSICLQILTKLSFLFWYLLTEEQHRQVQGTYKISLNDKLGGQVPATTGTSHNKANN